MFGKLNIIAAIAAMASLAGGPAINATSPPANTRPSRRLLRSTPSMAYQKRNGTLKYPEQSQRQALRGQRRAQGGPGL